MIVTLFGLLGCGKNFVGKILADEFGFYLYDADQDLTPAMKTAIAHHQVFTDRMRDEYFVLVVNRIAEVKEANSDVVVAQALFKNKHRLQILGRFPDAQFIWVQSRPDLIEARLAARTDHPAGKHYGELVNRHFEIPTIAHEVLMNNGRREEILSQLRRILWGEARDS